MRAFVGRGVLSSRSVRSSAWGLGLATCLALASAEGSARAQPKKENPQLNLRRESPGGADAQAARGRARAGDCAGALGSFDAALRTGSDPILRRDRGLCHDKLGNPYPALDDYRAYVTAQPEAPDAEQIRQRILQLEQQTGTGGPAKEGGGEGGGGSSPDGNSANASLSIGSGGAKASASSSGSGSSSGSSDGAPRDYEAMVEHEKLVASSQSSPLRYGSGLVLGPFVHLPRFFVGEKAATDLAYGTGLALRYSTGSTITLVSELGYAGIGTSGENTAQAGPLLMAGVEARLALSNWASDHLLLRAGIGYERYVVSGTRAVNGNVLGRFALGYRHVFGPAVGLELLADGGPALVVPENGDSRLNGVIGGSVAFVVGF
jgi:hypothetical protein